MIRRFLLSLVLMTGMIVLWANAWAGYQLYSAPLSDADWQLEVTALHCRLSQVIPGYGTAEFSRMPKTGLGFKMHVKEAANRSDIARLYSLPPEWRHYTEPRELGSVPVIKGKTPFYLGEKEAQRLLSELHDGMAPTFVYPDWIDGEDEVTVRLIATNFAEPLARFRECRQGLLGFTFSDVRLTVIAFANKTSGLDSYARGQLDKVARLMKEDTSVKRIKLDSYTDSKGLSRHNLKVSQRRGKLVKDYFISKGIDAKRITLVAHDETKGPFSNRTEAGRAKNRRVVVTLLR